jgi:acetyltransferase-like isoleucine patch superfamily enzyme
VTPILESFNPCFVCAELEVIFVLDSKAVMKKHCSIGIAVIYFKVWGYSVFHRSSFHHGYRCKIESPFYSDCEKLDLGSKVNISSSSMFRYGQISIGDNSFIGERCILMATKGGGITIGKNVMISSDCFIADCNHGLSPSGPMIQQPISSKEVDIEDDVWIGTHSCILKGVHIGHGAVVGANSTVTHDVLANSIVAGTPAKPIGQRK